MNYLAHAFLSFNNRDILVGNMISDFVKGKDKFSYPPGILNGINLHRMIDNFTDVHPSTKASKSIFKEAAGPYAGAFMDVVYDHFLANDIKEFSNESLAIFAESTYMILHDYTDYLPEKFGKMMPFMSSQNWLYNYRTHRGIESSFGGVFRRAKYIEHTDEVFLSFKKNYAALQFHYEQFFPAVKTFALEELKKMTDGKTPL